MALGAYIHIPFCGYKCHFCDFVTAIGKDEQQAKYCQVLTNEIEERLSPHIELPHVETIFYGGGTPGILDGQYLTNVHNTLLSKIKLSAEAEVSLETTPEAIDIEKAKLWRGLGINRLSIGVQSFDDHELAGLGRGHTVDQAIKAIDIAVEAGFENINCDLMYGLPNQDLVSWRNSLLRFIELADRFPQIKHVSAYALELANSTPLAKMFPAGSRAYADDDEFEHQYRYLLQSLEQAGFSQYEISNFSKKGFSCRHNLNYWRLGNYLAFGVSAHRYLNSYRSSNWRSLQKYLEDCLGEETCELIDRSTAIKEAIMLGLRMTEGINLAQFEHEFGLDLMSVHAELIARLIAANKLTYVDGRLKLTVESQLIANLVIGEFV